MGTNNSCALEVSCVGPSLTTCTSKDYSLTYCVVNNSLFLPEIYSLVSVSLFLVQKKKNKTQTERMKLLAWSHCVISAVEAELELEADRQPLPIPNGDKSFLIKSNMGQLPNHEFSNVSGLSPVLVCSLELSRVHKMQLKIFKHRLMKDFHFAL